MEEKYKKAGALLASLGIAVPAEYTNKPDSPGSSELDNPAVEVKTVGGFVDLVERMREAQRSFFESNGSRVYLQKARELEKQVDTCIAARRKRENQPELVPEGV